MAHGSSRSISPPYLLALLLPLLSSGISSARARPELSLCLDEQACGEENGARIGEYERGLLVGVCGPHPSTWIRNQGTPHTSSASVCGCDPGLQMAQDAGNFSSPPGGACNNLESDPLKPAASCTTKVRRPGAYSA